MLSETWYSNGCKMIHVDGYDQFYLNRSTRRGGGIALLTTKRKNCTIVPEFSTITDHYEILTVQSKNDIISVLYRPPNGNIPCFINFYESFLEYVCKYNFRLISGGDFNLNVLEQNADTRNFNALLASSGFTNVISTATRITSSSSTALDLIITNIDTEVLSAGTICCDISDHCPVFLIYQSEHANKKKKTSS